MNADSWKYVFRRPRHPADRAGGYRAEVHRSAENGSAAIEAALVNVSRDGFQLRLPAPLDTEETITLRLCDEESEFSLTLPGTVRWQRREDAGTWLLGCSTACPVAWEALGELFLNEVLAAGGPSS